MASLGPKNGEAVAKQLGRRARSASFSSDSSGGGAPLHASMSDLSIQDNHQRSASEMPTSRVGEPTNPVTPSTNLIQNIRDNTRHQASFQIGKPPRDDEEVFDAKDSMTRHMLAGPVPIINQASTSDALAVIPIVQAQLSPADRRHLVQGVDAQTYYPPEACVFVANLPESKSDTVLEVGITKAFSVFGPVFVKIRRDPKNMPFAFCQYTDPKHAEKAQRDGKGLLIEGRACRTEMVKANRSYVMYNRQGHQVNIAEARTHLLQYGEIERLEPLHEEAARIMNLPGAVFVEYKHFDPSRDIIAAYRWHDEYSVVAYDLKRAAQPRPNNGANYLMRYEVDRRSIYVGNLPHQVQNLEDVLRHAASTAGTVENIQLIQKPPRNEGGRPTIFAFVEYARPDEALAAVDLLRGTMIIGNRIRVEKKNFRDPGNQPRIVAALPTVQGEETAVSARPAPATVQNEGDGIVPATPARPAAITAAPVAAAAASGSSCDVKLATSPSVSPDPDYRPQGVALRPGRTFATPTAYQRTITSPDQGYQRSTLTTPREYLATQYAATPHQGYQQNQYVSPGYTLSPAYPRNFTQGGYNPATPPIAPGIHTPYDGSAGSYYQTQTSPDSYWQTPYLQDENAAYRYYSGYGQQRTPMHLAARSVSVVNAGQTPTRPLEQAAQQQTFQTGEQAGQDVGGEDTGEHN
ncbi:hypothetical protein HD806DRAFT_531961 [Xylariaceae sp. AK1471]|nr:hypothetical protein HD806DRAFT_531961 [Xylariaceae sp. AK1471]